MLSNELLCQGGSHRMAKQHQRYFRMMRSDVAVEHPKIVHTTTPAIVRGKEAEIVSAFAGQAMPAMIIGINRISRGV